MQKKNKIQLLEDLRALRLLFSGLTLGWYSYIAKQCWLTFTITPNVGNSSVQFLPYLLLMVMVHELVMLDKENCAFQIPTLWSALQACDGQVKNNSRPKEKMIQELLVLDK